MPQKILDKLQNVIPGESLLTEIEAGKFLNMSVSFLKLHRMRGDGPAFLKLGRSVRYHLQDLQGWFDKHRKQGTAA